MLSSKAAWLILEHIKEETGQPYSEIVARALDDYVDEGGRGPAIWADLVDNFRRAHHMKHVLSMFWAVIMKCYRGPSYCAWVEGILPAVIRGVPESMQSRLDLSAGFEKRFPPGHPQRTPSQEPLPPPPPPLEGGRKGSARGRNPRTAKKRKAE